MKKGEISKLFRDMHAGRAEPKTITGQELLDMAAAKKKTKKQAST